MNFLVKKIRRQFCVFVLVFLIIMPLLINFAFKIYINESLSELTIIDKLTLLGQLYAPKLRVQVTQVNIENIVIKTGRKYHRIEIENILDI